MKSIIAAFSTYSKIPMPHVEFDEKHMRYSMSAFPLVGGVIGFIYCICFFVIFGFGWSVTLQAVVLTSLPLIITGGIHMDGYMDTYDALCSYGDRHKKLQILKDPHLGAFAVIHLMIYILLYYGFTWELCYRFRLSETKSVFLNVGTQDERLAIVAMGFVLSRILSGLAVCVFSQAKEDGLCASTKKTLHKGNLWILLVELILAVMVMTQINFHYGITAIVLSSVCFVWYWYMSKKQFGGITGDLAGWFLQNCELAVLIAMLLF